MLNCALLRFYDVICFLHNFSPTGVKLCSLSDVEKYLLKEGTCKCGLECPLIAEKVFVFDQEVTSKHNCVSDVRSHSDMTNLCNHKRKIIAMATFHQSTGLHMNLGDCMLSSSSSSTDG